MFFPYSVKNSICPDEGGVDEFVLFLRTFYNLNPIDENDFALYNVFITSQNEEDL